MTGCTHGMPSPASCWDCFYEGNLPATVRTTSPTVVARFTARYPGDCTDCNQPIREGQRVVSLTDGSYRHEGCEP